LFIHHFISSAFVPDPERANADDVGVVVVMAFQTNSDLTRNAKT